MERRSFLALLVVASSLVLCVIFWPTELPQKVVDGRCVLYDPTAATSLAYVPWTGTRIGLHDGQGWRVRRFSAMTVAIPPTATTMHDVFVDGRTMQLALTEWADDTHRVVPLHSLGGAFVRLDLSQHRYVCTFRTLEAGRTVDTDEHRYLFNYYNRTPRPQRVVDSWQYP